MKTDLQKIMEVKDDNGVAHGIYGDQFVAFVLADVLARLNTLEAKEAQERGHDA